MRILAQKSAIVCSLVLLGAQAVVPCVAHGQITKNNSRLSLPDSRLHRTFEDPIFITGHLGVGGSFQHGQGLLNYGGSFIFRPGSSANFIDFLHRMNSAMVLRLDYQSLGPDSRNVSADLLVRHYFGDRGTEETEVLPFFGLGLGASDVNLSAALGGGNSRYWSYSAEIGQEWYFRPRLVVVARFQYRIFNRDDIFLTTWTVTGAVGIPVPW